MHNLMILFLIPLASALFVAVQPFLKDSKNLKGLAFLLSLLPLLFLITKNINWLGTSVNYPWLSPLSINFNLGIDPLSLLFLFLTAIIIPIVILSVDRTRLTHPNAFYALVLLLQGLLIGFFTAKDLVVFTIFYEAMLLPLYFIINIWGGPQRQEASLKFLIYMVAGSALMIAAILFAYLAAGTFNIEELSKVAASSPYVYWMAGIFLLAFAVKTPLFPFHGWLPDAYYQAPVPGTILLSALLSKAGIYGILRIILELFPKIVVEWSPILITLAIIGVFYAGLAAWMQNDVKRLIAYSSLSHVNLILVGLFTWKDPAHGGAILQALNHGITITGLFLVAAWLANRLGTTSINAASGLTKYIPKLAWLTFIFILSNIALPSMNNFVGELMIFLGLFKQHPIAAAILSLSVVLSVMYMLRWMQKMYFGPATTSQSSIKDIGLKEIGLALPLIALIFWIGLYPSPVLKLVKPAADKIAVEANTDANR